MTATIETMRALARDAFALIDRTLAFAASGRRTEGAVFVDAACGMLATLARAVEQLATENERRMAALREIGDPAPTRGDGLAEALALVEADIATIKVRIARVEGTQPYAGYVLIGQRRALDSVARQLRDLIHAYRDA